MCSDTEEEENERKKKKGRESLHGWVGLGRVSWTLL